METACRATLSAFFTAVFASTCLADGPTSSGTGFAVTTDGWLLTNAHVVQGCQRIEVKSRGDAIDPRIDTANDLALVKINAAESFKPLVFRRAPTRLGEDILAIGFPLATLLSDSVKVTTGNVNALAGLRNDTRYLQISTPIQPGNSGGPVVDRDGFLVGITSATLSKGIADEIGITAQNVNFAIRASVAELFLQSQRIAGQSGDRAADQQTTSTADLADKITPSVFQILCYGEEQEQASTKTPSATTNLPAQPAASLIDARGYDAIGFDYRAVKDVTYSGCREICQGDSLCRAITYNTKHGVCFLKDNVVALIRNSDAVAAYASSKAADVIVSDFTSYSGIDLPGGDYKRLRGSNYLQCFTACIGDNACKAFSYVPKKSECWLKDTIGRPKATKGVELGIK
ncbi:trypsin-like peptidase domain-containing protein [Rhizobium phaseoli]|uniref:trypsin-like peptidase domain-containing protein n=1 Tax=Rhizobium phaseoli TaxID=396 RepID=UPI0014385323|nr:trypsin-like peptidase domain-containing protein [Rhizobium phaseoli]MDK4724925.1 trypsin-like peptidase domain-containing protein [Rhizobium phaseoli]NKE87248.1 trypsin-like serine protease [Rhizobium phaseoli]